MASGLRSSLSSQRSSQSSKDRVTISEIPEYVSEEIGGSILKLLRDISGQVKLLAEVPRQLSNLQATIETQNDRHPVTHQDTNDASPSKAREAAMLSRQRAPRMSVALIGSDAGKLESMLRPPLNDFMMRKASKASAHSNTSNGNLGVLPNVIEDTYSINTPSSQPSLMSVEDTPQRMASAARWVVNAGLSESDRAVTIELYEVSRKKRVDLKGVAHGCMLAPGGRAKLFWNIWILAVTVVIGALVPLSFAYWDMPTLDSADGLVAVYIAIDVALVTDIFVRFRTGFKSSSGEVVTNAYSIASRYLQTWFLPNVLAAWPTVLLPQFVRVTLALKLLRVLELDVLMSNIQDILRHVRLTWLKVALVVALAIHSMACAWRAVQQANDTREIDQRDWARQYIVDVYWVVMTMTTVGYGDIPVVGTAPRLFATGCMLVGAVVFGFILSFVSADMQHFLDDDISKTLAEVRTFMMYRKVSPELQVRVEQNIRDAILTERREILRPAIFSKLSLAMQCDLSLELLSDVILSFPLFVNQPRNFIAEIARAHAWVRALQGEVVVEEGQVVQELIFVVSGTVMVVEPHGSGNNVTWNKSELQSGAWMGESCLFDDNLVREYSAVASKNTELAVLAADAYHRIQENYPRIVKRHESLKEDIKSGELKLEGLSYKSHLKYMGWATTMSGTEN